MKVVATFALLGGALVIFTCECPSLAAHVLVVITLRVGGWWVMEASPMRAMLQLDFARTPWPTKALPPPNNSLFTHMHTHPSQP